LGIEEIRKNGENINSTFYIRWLRYKRTMERIAKTLVKFEL